MPAENPKVGLLIYSIQGTLDKLEKKGYKIVEQNYRTKFAEIDLVAKQGKELVFVEVRTKRGELFGTPEESLNKKKLRKLWWNSQGYVNKIHCLQRRE